VATTTRTGPVVLFVLGAMSAAVSGTPRRDAELHLTPLCHLEHSKPALYTRGKKLVKFIDIEASSSEVADCARFALSRADDGWSADGHWASNSKRNNTWKYVATSQLRQVRHATFRTGLGYQIISQIISLPLWHALYVSARYRRQPSRSVDSSIHSCLVI